MKKILFILFCLGYSTFSYSFDESYGATVGIGTKDSIIGGIDDSAGGGIGFIGAGTGAIASISNKKNNNSNGNVVGGHDNIKGKSSKGKHEIGDARRREDQLGEKKEKNGRYKKPEKRYGVTGVGYFTIDKNRFILQDLFDSFKLK